MVLSWNIFHLLQLWDFFFTIENLTGCSLDDDYNISKIQFIDSFKQNPKRIWYDKIQQ